MGLGAFTPWRGRRIVVFDLEYTAWPGAMERNWSGPGELREIIQIGAVKAEVTTGMAEIGCFSMVVRPARNPLLSDYITALTGITQAQVDDQGVPFAQALAAFLAFVGDDSTTEVCSNGSDDLRLYENCRLYDLPEAPLAALRFRNLRPWLTARLGPGAVLESCRLLENFGPSAGQPLHDGLGDARIILETLRRLGCASM